MPHFSKERVERDGYLVYAEGDEIPETDTDEIKRQGFGSESKKSEPKDDAPAKPSTSTRKKS